MELGEVHFDKKVSIEMLEYYEQPLQMGLRLLSLVGLNPKATNNRTAITVAIILMLVMSYLVILGFIYDEHSVKNITDLILSASLIFHVTNKIQTLVIKKKPILNYIVAMDKFWAVNCNKNDEGTKSECKKILKYCNWLLKAFIANALTVLCSSFFPVFFGGDLAFSCYIPKTINYYAFMIFNDFCYVYLAPIAIGFDCISLVFVLLLWMQFRIFNKMLKTADYKDFEYKRTLDIYIQHHSFLLNQIDELNKIYGTMLLVYLWNEIPLMCVMLYIITESNEDLRMMTKLFVLLLAQTTEMFFFYFLPAQYLTMEASKVVDSIYFSEWNQNVSPSTKKSLIMMMTRAQKESIIYAGKMLPMNYQTCTSMFKTTFSFFTFLRNMKN